LNILKKTILIISVLFLQGCLQPRSPEISFSDSSFHFLSFTDLGANFNFKIYNPNSFPLEGIVNYKLSINNNDFLAGKSSPINLSSNEDSTFTIDAKINLPKSFGMISDMIKTIREGKDQIPFTLQGTFQSSITLPLIEAPVDIPLTIEGTIPLPKLPEIRLVGISVPKVDLSGITLELQTDFKNPNNFPLIINSLFYQLADGEKVFAEGGLKNKLTLEANNNSKQTWQLNLNYGALDASLLNKLKSESFKPELKSLIQGIQ